MPVPGLEPSALCQRCDPNQFKFETTEELEHLGDFIGQPRAVEAMKFGVGIRQKGYNIFALGPEGIGKGNLVLKTFQAAAANGPVPFEWCYVYNFEQPGTPRALQLPSGRGVQFRQDMERFAEDLKNVLPVTFESEEYRTRMHEVQESLNERQEGALSELRKEAQARELTVLQTPAGLAVAPVRNGEVISPEEFQGLPEERRGQLEKDIAELQQDLQKLLLNVPRWQRELRAQIDGLYREMADLAVGALIRDLTASYEGLPEVQQHLAAVQQDVVKNVREIIDEGDPSQLGEMLGARGLMPTGQARPALRRYRVNLLVDHGRASGAPVIQEDNPTYQNLLGRVEYTAQMGAWITDFNLIKPGALHRANGGYLILEARKLLAEPFAWEGLKRALRSEQIKIETPGQVQSFISTVSLDPQPIPLQVKVGLLGEPMLYYLLGEYDPESRELFRVASDFDDQMDRDEPSQLLYARLIGSLAKVNGLKPLDRQAVARVIERSSRIVGDGRKLSIQMNLITDLMREADYWAGAAGRQVMTGEDILTAADAQIYRSDRFRERIQEMIKRRMILIDTEGGQIGQVNGLSVTQFGDFTFGHPSRISARVWMGKGEVIDIEREVELGGPIHSKGVLILSSLLGSRYATGRPLSLAASLVFEQTYGGVEGDSASSAELYALLSAIAEVPVKQTFAVTGSINQHGQVQSIGAVNEKIEGFFDICKFRGLTGEQAVLIPSANVEHLMLKDEVVQAVAAGKFHVYPVETIDQGIEMLTGMPAGEQDEQGNYPEQTINGLVQARLTHWAEERAATEAAGEREDGNPSGASDHDESELPDLIAGQFPTR